MAWAISVDNVHLLEAIIDHVVDDIMKKDIADGLKKEVKRMAQERVYNAYPTPKFNSRWGDDAGILDESLMTTEYANNTLTLYHYVAWQHLRGGVMPSNELIDVIQNNGMYGARPRPYLEEAKDSYVAEKADADMQHALGLYGL